MDILVWLCFYQIILCWIDMNEFIRNVSFIFRRIRMPVLPLVKCQQAEANVDVVLVHLVCSVDVFGSIRWTCYQYGRKHAAIKASFQIHFDFPAAQFICFWFEFCNLLRCRKLNRKLWQALKMSFRQFRSGHSYPDLIYLFSLLWLFVP